MRPGRRASRVLPFVCQESTSILFTERRVNTAVFHRVWMIRRSRGEFFHQLWCFRIRLSRTLRNSMCISCEWFSIVVVWRQVDSAHLRFDKIRIYLEMWVILLHGGSCALQVEGVREHVTGSSARLRPLHHHRILCTRGSRCCRQGGGHCSIGEADASCGMFKVVSGIQEEDRDENSAPN